ncbi:MAG: hypothetical protein KDD22_08475, partial [Bdellovibrionales bacterium]|nr:hypothetical protein [Bdellovibrionales bacterium]
MFKFGLGTFILALGAAISLITTGCGVPIRAAVPKSMLAKASLSLDDPGLKDPIPDDTNPLPDNGKEEPDKEPPPEKEELSICSSLPYAGVTWPTALNYEDKNAFLLALNISGSFEGPHHWENLTNNFDGMGLSLGLLNQTLGTGSLQPLLAKFRKRYPTSYAAVFTSSQRTAINQMLDAWEHSSGVIVTASSAPEEYEEPPERELIDFSLFDSENMGKFYALLPRVSAYSSANTSSVQWALQNLYVQTSSNNHNWK